MKRYKNTEKKSFLQKNVKKNIDKKIYFVNKLFKQLINESILSYSCNTTIKSYFKNGPENKYK